MTKNERKQYLGQWRLVQSPLAMYLAIVNNVLRRVFEVVIEKLNSLAPHYETHNLNPENPYVHPENFPTNFNIIQMFLYNSVVFSNLNYRLVALLLHLVSVKQKLINFTYSITYVVE